MSENSVQRVRNLDYRSSSPEKCMRDRISVSEDGVDYGLHHIYIMIYIVIIIERCYRELFRLKN